MLSALPKKSAKGIESNPMIMKVIIGYFTSGMSEAIFQRSIANGETKIEMTISREIMTTNSKSKREFHHGIPKDSPRAKRETYSRSARRRGARSGTKCPHEIPTPGRGYNKGISIQSREYLQGPRYTLGTYGE